MLFSPVFFRRSLFFIFTFVLVCINQANAQTAAKQPQIPVVLIHGIGGADLDYRTRGLLRNGFPNDVLKGFPGDPQNLQFTSDGEPRTDTISPDIKATKFYKVPRSKNITDLSKYLQKDGFVKDTDLFEFFYDFRFSVERNSGLLRKFIKDLKDKTKSSQIDVVAHSMGGMIIKQYLIDNPENAPDIRKIIFVGTPHLGAPKALKVLRYGDNMDVSLIDGCKMKRVAHNLPSMFNLMPGRRYFEVSGSGIFEDTADIDGNNVRGTLDFDQTIYNLINGKESKCRMNPKVDAAPFDSLSQVLVEKYLVKFHEMQDNWKKPVNIKIYSIVGYGVPTVKKLAENNGEITVTYTTGGDGTVPLISAESVDADKIYYVNLNRFKTDHARMIGENEFDKQISNLLRTDSGIILEDFSIIRPNQNIFKETTKVSR